VKFARVLHHFQFLLNLSRKNRELRLLDHAKDKFIALTTHELRTPISAIVATSEVLHLKLYESDEQRDEFIKTVHEQSLHLLELVNDILDLSKIRAGKMEFFVERLDVAEVIAKTITEFESLAQTARVHLAFERPEHGSFAYADELRLREVLSNVLSNAIKYNRSGGRVDVALTVRANSILRVAVRDTGRGIKPEDLRHVFNEFETVEVMARHHKGTGLGMPISQSLIRTMGGELSLESRFGEGSCFYIDIPIGKVLTGEMYRTRGAEAEWGEAAA
jgi:signal transduction histidine kinase